LGYVRGEAEGEGSGDPEGERARTIGRYCGDICRAERDLVEYCGESGEYLGDPGMYLGDPLAASGVSLRDPSDAAAFMAGVIARFSGDVIRGDADADVMEGDSGGEGESNSAHILSNSLSDKPRSLAARFAEDCLLASRVSRRSFLMEDGSFRVVAGVRSRLGSRLTGEGDLESYFANARSSSTHNCSISFSLFAHSRLTFLVG
jgi:hypothetical protein